MKRWPRETCDFVQRVIHRIHEITKSGTTALFVSHNIWSIKRLTERCILINGGKVADDGDTSRVADRYLTGSCLRARLWARILARAPTGDLSATAKFNSGALTFEMPREEACVSSIPASPARFGLKLTPGAFRKMSPYRSSLGAATGIGNGHRGAGGRHIERKA